MSGGRTLIIGDIHGCSRTLRRLVEMIELTRDDTLYLLGDLIDRGNDSKGVIEAILALQKAGFDIRPIRGNHEEMMLLAIRSGVFEDLLEWLSNGENTTLANYGVEHLNDIAREHLMFLEELPYYRNTPQYLFVHAGLDFSLDYPLSEAGRTAMLWTRNGKVNSRKIGERTMVTGHSTKTLDEIKKSLTTKHIRIDNGCCLGSGFIGKGNLVAVNLGTGELFVQPNIDMAPADLY